MAAPSAAEERKMPGEKKGSSGKKKGKKERALTCGAGAQRERKREGERRGGFG